MKNTLKSALVLTGIAVVAGILLAVVYKFTYVPYVFEMTAEDKAAIESVTDSKTFSVIDHAAISENANIRVILKAKDGADAGNYFIRSTAIGWAQGAIDSYILIENDTIKAAAAASIDSKNDRWTDEDTDELIAKVIGKSSLSDFGKTDGTAGATYSSGGLYNSIKNSLDYYNANKTAIKSASEASEVSVGTSQPEDKFLTAVKELYPNATRYTLLAEYTVREGVVIATYTTNRGDLFFSYQGTVYYTHDEGDDSYAAEIIMKLDTDGQVDGEPVYIKGMKSYMQDAIDGIAGATGSTTFVDAAKTDVEAYWAENAAAVTGGIQAVLDVDADTYLVVMQGTTTAPADAYFYTYNYKVAITVANGTIGEDGVKLLMAEGGNSDYMQNAIDGVAGATHSTDSLGAVKQAAVDAVATIGGQA